MAPFKLHKLALHHLCVTDNIYCVLPPAASPLNQWEDGLVFKKVTFLFTLIRAPRTVENEAVQHIALIYNALPHLSAGSRHPQWRPRGCFVGGPE